MQKPRISVLVSARPDSKYLAKFLYGFHAATNYIPEVECLIMLNEHDTWNNELVKYYEDIQDAQQAIFGKDNVNHHIKFFRENKRLGRAGLHEYFNDLAAEAKGDWLIYFCEDHFIYDPGWKQYFLAVIDGHIMVGDSEGKTFPLDPREPWVLVPKFDNCGAMNHMVSRGFYEAMGNKIGRHGWIDSYINDVMKPMPERVIRMDEATFHDFTHDIPNPMEAATKSAVITDRGKLLPTYGRSEVEQLIVEDRAKLVKSIERGQR